LTPLEAAKLVPPPSTDEPEPEFDDPLPTVRGPQPTERGDGPAVRLWNMLAAQDVDVKEAWQFFHEQYIQPGKEGKALRRPAAEDQVVIREKKLFRQVLRTVASHWQPGQDDTPTPADVVNTMHEYGIMGQGWYLLEILEMLYRVRRLGTSIPQERDDESIKHKQGVVGLALWFCVEITNR